MVWLGFMAINLYANLLEAGIDLIVARDNFDELYPDLTDEQREACQLKLTHILSSARLMINKAKNYEDHLKAKQSRTPPSEPSGHKTPV